MKKLISLVVCSCLLLLSGVASVPRTFAGEDDTWTGDVIIIDPEGEIIFDDEVTIATTTVVDIDDYKHHLFFPTALGALDEASWKEDFEYEVEEGEYGLWVTSIDGYEKKGMAGWMYKVDDEIPEVGADECELEYESEVVWYWSSM